MSDPFPSRAAETVDPDRIHRPSAATLRVRYRLTPWWAKVAVVFLASRVITTLLLLAFASIQGANYWTGAHPGYFSFATIWDGNWYNIVSVAGYPHTLPVTADGHIDQNAWAFLPLYPIVVGSLVTITGVPFAIVGVWVSVICALGAALVFYRMIVRVLPASTALFSVVLFCVAPLSPILQVTYAESMQLLFLCLSLLYLMKRRYWVMLLFVALMSFTRPSGLAFALALAIHVVYRFVTDKRDPFPVRERVAAITTAFLSGVLGLAWPAIAWAATGLATAYTDTELSWRAAYIGYGGLLPFTPWIDGANWWIPIPGLGVVLLVVALALFAVVMFTPAVRRLGPDLRIWTASWVIYLLAIFFPQSSTFRLLMPAFPLLGVIAQPRSTTYRIVVVVLAIVGQIGWIYIAWWVDGVDWTPP